MLRHAKRERLHLQVTEVDGLNTFQLVAAAVHFVPALVWAIVAQNSWRLVRTRQLNSPFFKMLVVVAGVVALNYGVFTLVCLIPREVTAREPVGIVILYLLNDWGIFMVVASARHMARYFPSPEQPPTRAWLALNYGSCVLMGAFTLFFLGLVHPPGGFALQRSPIYSVVRVVYQVVMIGLILLQVIRIRRPGGWATSAGASGTRRADVVFLAGGLLSLSAWLLVVLTTNLGVGLWEPSNWNTLLDAIAGVGFAAPLAVRMLGEVVRGVLLVTVMVLATAAVYAGAGWVSSTWVSADLRSLVNVGAVLVVVLVLVPGQSWLRAAIDGLLFRRSRRRREELQSFLHTLSPELSPGECCRRTLPEVARVMGLRGAAVLLQTGETMAHGTVSPEAADRLARAGVAGGDLPERPLVGYELRELPNCLADVLNQERVVGVVPINSPRRRWGVLLFGTGLLGATFGEEDEQTLQAFADQLALVLDGAELLARTVAVERSLAHREKLAAIGELAARMAHEIRNPVTAARSLAQQLAREPASPLNIEHAGLILSELERVERQVAALLRFSRREEFHFEPVDLSALVRTTAEHFQARLEGAGIELELQSPTGVTASADAEKLRQVLINLIENAIEALGASAGKRRLSLWVGSANGTVSLRVMDTGPGVSSEALAQVFEPFFSLKPHGTGLGLAIAKRTIEAHGGRIEAASPPQGGMSFLIELPAGGGHEPRPR